MNKIKLYWILLISLFIIVGCSDDSTNPTNNKAKSLPEEATIAFEYLNKVRSNPSAYSNEIGDDLSYIPSIHALKWNEILAEVALNKAKDMANRNYFAHVDPDGNGINILINNAGYHLIDQFIDKKSNNNFESLQAGIDKGKEIIKSLILDDGYVNRNDKGHRIHLLGLNEFYKNCYDIGIGITYNENSTYKYYCSVIIAKHDF